MPIAVIHGELERESAESDLEDGRNSPPLDTSDDSRRSVFEIPNLSIPIRNNPKEKYPMDVVGDVSGRIAIIVVKENFK